MKSLGTHTLHVRRYWTQAVALVSAAALTMTLPAAAVTEHTSGVTPTYDEAYYATLDYYGNLTEGSVVKSYALNGTQSITDYGAYEQVINLTDGTQPEYADGKTSFQFGDSVPDHFYFEGRTAQPFEELPWQLSITYTLNGVPTEAEDLAGKTGEVEITINAVPNPNASQYARYNYTMEAMALFNADDILSLQAEGAQVQLIGNLRVVLFLALPGEEQHFVIRVGAEDFSFDGITFLMTPATLSQLDQIAELGQKKDDLEENYDKLSGSLDTLLDALDGMGSSLNATANGLDELNQARGALSAGKGEVYNQADKVLSDLDALNESLSPLPGHIDTTAQAVTDVQKDLNDLDKTADTLYEQLDDLLEEMRKVQNDLNGINASLQQNLKPDLDTLGQDIDRLKGSLSNVNSTVGDLELTVGGSTLSVGEAAQKADELHSSFAAVDQDGSGSLSFAEFFTAGLVMAGTAADTAAKMAGAYASGGALYPEYHDAAAAQAPLFEQFYLKATGAADAAGGAMTFRQFITAALLLQAYQENFQPALEAKLQELGNPTDAATVAQVRQAVSAAVAAQVLADDNLEQAKSTASSLESLYSGVSSGLYQNLSALCSAMGSSGLSGDLSALTVRASHSLSHLDDVTEVCRDILNTAQSALTQAGKMNDTINRYIPDLQTALTEAKTLATTATTTLSDTRSFLTTFEALAKTAGAQLDTGTRDTLTSLAATLRKAASGLSATGDVKTAKNNISGIIEDTWSDYTGDVNNLLNMDSTAEAVSLTSAENEAPQSIQILIRTQEIKQSKPAQQTAEKAAADNGTFFSRVGQMFRDLWSSITGIFHR